MNHQHLRLHCRQRSIRMDQWYYRDRDGEIGPLYSDEIQFLVQSGQISELATIRRINSNHWIGVKASPWLTGSECDRTCGVNSGKTG